MTLITDLSIAPLGLGALRLSWSGIAGAVVRVFLNGALAFGPSAMPDSGKAVTVSASDPFTLEVHENDASENVTAASVPLERKPLFWWSSIPGATEYHVYVDDALLAVVRHESWRLHHQHQLEQDIRVDGGTWTSFRIEAVSANGTETVTAARSFFAPGVLRAATGVEVTGGGGVFDLSVVGP